MAGRQASAISISACQAAVALEKDERTATNFTDQWVAGDADGTALAGAPI
jgi:hypothetical protein